MSGVLGAGYGGKALSDDYPRDADARAAFADLFFLFAERGK